MQCFSSAKMSVNSVEVIFQPFDFYDLLVELLTT